MTKYRRRARGIPRLNIVIQILKKGRQKSMIYITGDTHIPLDIAKLHPDLFKDQESMTKSDFLVICGDFGGVWRHSIEEMFWRKWLSERNFTTLFVDGNHENFDLLNAYPVEEFKGGKVHKIIDDVYHLMRGEVFDLNGIKIFAMGGATSIDKSLRVEGESWWAEELPSDAEYENAVKNLALHGNKVDYVITHCAPDSVLEALNPYFAQDKLTNFLQEEVFEKCEYKEWYFGHYHADVDVDERHFCLYKSIIRVV
jgi:predicted phosphodiesterase